MTQLETLIQTLCPNGVKSVKLGDCCQILDSQRRPITKSQREAGEYPYYGANGIQDYVADYIFDGVFVLVGEDGSVLTPNGNPVVTWAEGKIWVNNHAHILAGTEIAQLRFLFYVLQTLNISHLVHGNIPKLTKKDLQELQIPLPPLAVQSEIVRILDKFTLYKSELAAELAARLQQYEYYRDQLLTFDENTKRVKLGEVCNIKGRIGFRGYTRNDIVKAGEGAISLSPGNISGHTLLYDNCTYISWMKYDESPEIKVRNGDVLLCKTGSTLGKVAIVENLPEKATINPQLVVLKDIKCNNRFLKYLLTTSGIQNHIKARMGIGSVPNISQAVLNDILIPLPPLEVQEQIVAILDRFDALCNDIKIGLPAEIELRQKQYEHYRDKLLTFEAKG